MTEPLLKIPNRHSASCGDPPIVDGNNRDCYIGYFENKFGEQWIFSHNHKTGQTTLRGGDIGWNTEISVVNGKADGLVLGDDELIWLGACWVASHP